MSSLGKMLVCGVLLFATVNGQAAIKKNSSTTQQKSKVSAFGKQRDPGLYLGLGKNPAECAFQSKIAKNEASAGERFGKASALGDSSIGRSGNR